MPRSLLWAIRLSAVVAVMALTSLAVAGTTGKLSGRVVNEKKEPLAGVNVRIDGQRLGAITDDEGSYFIIGIPAGGYVVRMNLVGYAAYVAGNVEVSPDFTTTLNATMQSEAVQLNEVRVDATRPLLQKDATGTTRFISSEEVAKMPTRGYRDAAAQQTGVVNFRRQVDTESQNGNTLIIRGGRPNETAYFVDGFSQQDPLTGTSSTSISNNAIEEVVVLTGGFNAEYGRIMSGAVNVVTREGADKYAGSFEAVTDMGVGSAFGGQPSDYNVYDMSFGGPILPGMDNINFYVSGERRWQGDRSPTTMSGDMTRFLEAAGLDPDMKPNNSSGGFTFQGKVGWQINEAMSIKVGGLGSEDDWREYNHAYLLNLDHTPRYYDRNLSYNAAFNHVLSPKTFYNLSYNHFETLRKRGDGVHFDRLAEYARASNPDWDPDIPLFFEAGHVFDDYLQRKSSYEGVQGTLTSQVNRYHSLKVGGDYQKHTLRLFDHYFPVGLGDNPTPNLRDWDGYGYQMDVKRDAAGNITSIDLVEVDDGADGAKHPKVWSMFAQDKFEREGLIVNAGLRFDHIDVDTPALLSDSYPLGNPDDPNNLPDSLETKDVTDNKAYARISPRLGIAFPVDERTQIRFNYGQFYQQPNLQDLYVSYRFLQHKVRTGGYFVGFGNPNLRPERTTAYEVGVARQIGDRMRLDLTAYYKDVKDLVEITSINSYPNGFSSYRNRDYATIKGVDIGWTMRRTNHITTSVNYSLSTAMGTGSVSNTQGNIAWTSATPPKLTAPLDFDQRHKLSVNLDYTLEKGEGPTIAGGRWFENSTINILYNVGSGTPYTPTNVYNEVTLAATNSQPSGPINSRYGPWTMNLDLKASRGFQLGATHFQAFLWMLNVMGNDNAYSVYTSSGSPFSTTWLNTQDGQAFLANAAANGKDGLATYHLAENNPTNYANPRLVRFGFSTSF